MIYIFIHVSFIIFVLLSSLLVVTQIRGHIAGSFPPLPTTVRALHFLSRDYFSTFFPASTRVGLCPTTLGALTSSSFSISAN